MFALPKGEELKARIPVPEIGWLDAINENEMEITLEINAGSAIVEEVIRFGMKLEDGVAAARISRVIPDGLGSQVRARSLDAGDS